MLANIRDHAKLAPTYFMRNDVTNEQQLEIFVKHSFKGFTTRCAIYLQK